MSRNFISALAAIFVGAGAGMMTPSPYPTAVHAPSKRIGLAKRNRRFGSGGASVGNSKNNRASTSKK
jgi:hypothetical protein